MQKFEVRKWLLVNILTVFIIRKQHKTMEVNKLSYTYIIDIIILQSKSDVNKLYIDYFIDTNILVIS